ncbi:MFS transporter [Haloechinothrix halophila]|uniref:MFS transporter n=1 Tax=Haloechinothrix halophila TaxID=1069073 RepID=UPI000400B5A7|nr:MFS transporter [Haloechinothrix halophila]
MTTDDAPAPAGAREWFGLVVLALPTFVVAIDLFVLMLALPHMAADLGAGSNQQLWTMDMYGFMLAGFLVTMGTLGDRIGRRKLLLIGAAAFAAASLLAAYSTTPEMLIAARALLGIAGATLGPSTLALIGTLFTDPKQQATAFGIWGGTFTLGALFGPVIGGALLAQFWWGSIFLLGVPIMVLTLLLAPKFLPEFRNPEPGRVDLASVLLSLLALLPIVYGMKELARDGWETLPIVSLVIGLGAGFAFLRRQRSLRDPLLDLDLIRSRVIGTSLVGQLSYATVGGGIMLFMMLYFQLVGGMSTLQAGLAMVPGMAAGALGFTVAPKLGARFRPAHVIAVGLLGSAAALVFMTQVGPTSGSAYLIIGFAVFSFCGAPMAGLGTALVMGTSPPEKMGSAGSLAQMANEFGGTLGLAVLGTLGTAIYRFSVDGAIPAGIGESAATAARDSLAGANAVAGELPGDTASALLTPAREAFASGVQTVALTGAVLLVVIAGLVSAKLKSQPPIGQQAPADDAPTDSDDGAAGAGAAEGADADKESAATPG